MFKTQTGFLKFSHESAKARLTLWDDDTATVSGMYSRDRGKGHATVVLQEICDYADERGLTLELEVQSYGPETLDGLRNDQLTSWYYLVGFEVIEDPFLPRLMTRKPFVDEPTA